MQLDNDEANRAGTVTPDTACSKAAPSASQAPSQLWAHCLERWVCSVNIERMRTQLATATEQAERATLWRLLHEQEETMRRLSEADGER